MDCTKNERNDGDGNNMDEEIAVSLLTPNQRAPRIVSKPLWERNKALYVASWTTIIASTGLILRHTGSDVLEITLVWVILWCGQMALITSIGIWVWILQCCKKNSNKKLSIQAVLDFMDFTSFFSTKFLLIWSLLLVLVPYAMVLLFWVPSLGLPRSHAYALIFFCAAIAWFVNFFLVDLHIRLAMHLMEKLEAKLTASEDDEEHDIELNQPIDSAEN